MPEVKLISGFCCWIKIIDSCWWDATLPPNLFLLLFLKRDILTVVWWNRLIYKWDISRKLSKSILSWVFHLISQCDSSQLTKFIIIAVMPFQLSISSLLFSSWTFWTSSSFFMASTKWGSQWENLNRSLEKLVKV